MNKNDIKEKWGQYIDTDKLVDDMMALLTKYDHRNTEHGVCRVLDAFFETKEPLIKLLQKSEHYAGDLRIVLDEELERRSSSTDVLQFMRGFSSAVNAEGIIKKKTDANNKTIDDYIKIGRQKITADDLDNAEFISVMQTRASDLSAFTNDGFTVASVDRYREFTYAIDPFYRITASAIPNDIAEFLGHYKVHKGTKTSRAFNAVCRYFAVDKAPAYNKQFAMYADMVSGLKRHIKFFISVNPLDYLTMSFGVNWASCHTIDKLNVRRMSNSYSGMYCGGTMSYMLDPTSIVTYVHNEMPESYEDGKVYRNMFHLGGEGVLLQGRVYPQGNDGCTDLYKEFRSIMQKELASLLGLENNKWTRRSSIQNVVSSGVHYRDYNNYTDCNISYPSERPQCSEQIICVGSERICFYCGESAESIDSGCLAHHYCNIAE